MCSKIEAYCGCDFGYTSLASPCVPFGPSARRSSMIVPSSVIVAIPMLSDFRDGVEPAVGFRGMCAVWLLAAGAGTDSSGTPFGTADCGFAGCAAGVSFPESALVGWPTFSPRKPRIKAQETRTNPRSDRTAKLRYFRRMILILRTVFYGQGGTGFFSPGFIPPKCARTSL